MKKSMILIREWVLIAIACLLSSIALYTYIVANEFVAGGVGGIATMFEIAGVMQAWLAILIINIPLLILAVIFLNTQYAVKTVICTVVISGIMAIFEMFNLPVFTSDRLLAAVYSGIIYGIAIGLFYETNSSSGGTEIIARLIILKKPGANVAFILFLMDVVVMIAGLLIADIWSVVYGIVCAYVSAKAMDVYLTGVNLPVVYYIITLKADEVYDALTQYFKCGATKLQAKGLDNVTDKEVIVIVVKYRHISKLKSLLKQTDDEAFSFSVPTRSVLRRDYNKKET